MIHTRECNRTMSDRLKGYSFKQVAREITHTQEVKLYEKKKRTTLHGLCGNGIFGRLDTHISSSVAALPLLRPRPTARRVLKPSHTTTVTPPAPLVAFASRPTSATHYDIPETLWSSADTWKILLGYFVTKSFGFSTRHPLLSKTYTVVQSMHKITS